MSLVPILWNDLLDDYLNVRPRSLLGQNLGMNILYNDLILPRLHQGPYRHATGRENNATKVKCDDDGFEFIIDVQQFKPDEITVKTVGKSVFIEGKHGEREDDHGFISRYFKRRYILPECVDPKTVTSQLSSDGILTIHGPLKESPASGKERVISITKTNAPAQS